MCNTFSFQHLNLNPKRTGEQSVTQSKTHPQTTSQSRHLPLSISLSPSFNLKLFISTQILSFCLSNLPHSLSPSRSRSLSRTVAHALGLPLTRYVSLNLHVQLVGIFVCKFVIFMHSLILGFDLGGF